MRFGCRSRYISRYVNLKLGFLPFVVASIVAMVFFSAVFAARAPAMGNSADRAWQLSQLVEGVSTAFNPSHGSLSCAFPNLRCCPRCWLFSCLGVYFHLRISPKEHQKERCGHSRPQRSFITFYGALRNILLSAGFPAMFHMIAAEQMFVNNLSQKIFLADAASESNRFYQ